jgi:hypothetical protein
MEISSYYVIVPIVLIGVVGIQQRIAGRAITARQNSRNDRRRQSCERVETTTCQTVGLFRPWTLALSTVALTRLPRGCPLGQAIWSEGPVFIMVSHCERCSFVTLNYSGHRLLVNGRGHLAPTYDAGQTRDLHECCLSQRAESCLVYARGAIARRSLNAVPHSLISKT